MKIQKQFAPMTITLETEKDTKWLIHAIQMARDHEYERSRGNKSDFEEQAWLFIKDLG